MSSPRQAAAIHEALLSARAAWRAGTRDGAELRRRVAGPLERGPFTVEYAAIRDPAAWTVEEPDGDLERAVALVAARLGAVRLIDNLRLDVEGSP